MTHPPNGCSALPVPQESREQGAGLGDAWGTERESPTGTRAARGQRLCSSDTAELGSLVGSGFALRTSKIYLALFSLEASWWIKVC